MVRFKKSVLVLFHVLLSVAATAEPQSFSTQKELYAGKAGSIKAPTATLEVEAGTLKADLSISISSLAEGSLPKLDRGLTNVTDSVSGYRFLPHGEHFQGEGARVVLGYDRSKIPSGFTEDDIRTYYYDEAEQRWIALKRDSVDRRNRLVVSRTTHFTDMINGVLQVPESPETQGFAPTMMSELKAADPTAKVQMISAPEANSKGSANLSYSLEMPPGRNGMAPNLTVTYSSDAGSGWLGEGWNLSTSSISVDTRWGVPRYDGSETYLLDGEMLVKGATKNDGNEQVTTFYPRREGAFSTIQRIGNSFGTYRWEVTDRKGTKYSYGQWRYFKNDSGKRDSVLVGVVKGNYQMTANVVVSEWRLTRIEEIHGDYVEYKYREEVEDGFCRSLYLDSVVAGIANREPHTVVCLANRKEHKKIHHSDARYGYPVSANALLDSVNVYFEGKFLRGYVFGYKDGQYGADLLAHVSQLGTDKEVFSTHTMDYESTGKLYDDKLQKVYVNSTSGKGEEYFTVINGGCCTGDPSECYSVGGGSNGGLGPLYAGGSYDYGENKSKTHVSLMDINGDGLPDKVYIGGDGGIYYQPGLYGGDKFGLSKPVKGDVPLYFTENENASQSFGVDGGVGFGCASVGVTYGHGIMDKSSTKTYVYDVNSDGLVDIVYRGTVYFNHLKDGDVYFSKTSSGTPNPLGKMTYDQIPRTGGMSPEVDEEAIRDSLEADFPLYDAVRVWKAPFDGEVSLADTLVMQAAQPRKGRVPDGIRYFVQHNRTVVAKGTLKPSKQAVIGKTLNVKKGDYIFFRTNSVDNGEQDTVKSCPHIRYSQLAVPADENGCDLTSYDAQDDFIAGTDSTVVTSDNLERISLLTTAGSGYRKTGKTLSDLHLNIFKDRQLVKTVDLDKDYISAGEEFIVWSEQGEARYNFSVTSDLPYSPDVFRWTPVVTVTRTVVDTVTGLSQDVSDTLRKTPAADMYNNYVRVLPPVQISADTAKHLAKEDADGNLQLLAVLDDHLAVRRSGNVRTFLMDEDSHELVQLTDSTYLPLELWNGRNVRLLTYSDKHLDEDSHVRLNIVMDSVVKKGNKKDTVAVIVQTLESSIRSQISFNDSRLGMLYRGWGQFGVKGDTAKPNGAKGHEVLEKIDLSLVTSGFDASLFDGLGSINFSSELSATDSSKVAGLAQNIRQDGRLITMSYYTGHDGYVSEIPAVNVSRNSQSSTRKKKPYIDVEAERPQYPTAEQMASDGYYPAPAQVTVSTSNTVNGGVSAFVASGGYSHSWSSNSVRTAYMDLNGDGYPDWVSAGGGYVSVSYTKPDGTLANSVPVGGLKSLTEQSASAYTISGGNTAPCTKFNKGSFNFSRENLEAMNTAKKKSESSFSVSLNVNVSNSRSSSSQDWCDINGDGLADMVTSVGKVLLNLGYSFVEVPNAAVNAEDASYSSTSSRGASGSYAVQGQANVGFGATTSKSESYSTVTMRDINGDGLPDKLVLNGSHYEIYLNKGLTQGFEKISSIVPTSKLNMGKSKTVTIHGNFGATIYATLFNVTPFVNGGTTVDNSSGTISALNDFDGDGFPDLVFSSNENNMQVRYSRIGATNKLKTVTNPFGGSFTIDYAHTQPTCEHPGGKWAMTSLTVSDAAGSPDIHTDFEYSHGVRDRKERDFLGFGKVVTRAMDGTNTVRTTIQEYDVEHYLTAGALLKTTVAGADTSVLYRVEETRYAHYGVNGSKLTKNPDLKTAKRLFSAPARKQVTAYEGDTDGLELSEEVFDYTTDYGNIETYRFKDLTIGGRGYTTVIGYADKRYGTVNRVTVKGDDGKVYREAEATYTNTFTPWALSSFNRKLDDGQTAHFKFEYDHFGNLTRKESDSTFFTYTYERRYNMYPERVEDAFGYRSEMEDYDYRYGIPLTVRDMNGYTVKYHTDGYGRVDTIVAPNEQSAGAPFTIAYQYVNGNDYKTRCAVTHHYDVQHPDDPVTTVTHVDGLGRPFQVKKETEIDGSVRYIVSGKQVYDGLGRTIETTHPGTCVPEKALQIADFNTVWLNRTAYDAVDRPLTQTLPGDASGAESTTATAYGIDNGWLATTLTAPNGNRTVSYANGAGQTVETDRELDGKQVETRFFFDPVGQLDSLVDARGNVTRYTYDLAGRKLTVRHPSAGLTTFKYDVADNVLEKETENLRAEKKKIEYSYEKNRLKRVTYPNHPENNVTYTYGGVNADFNRVGRVALVEDGSGATEFFYGRMGEVVKQRRTLVIPNVAVATYTTKWKYDSQNRILEMEYPDEEKISYFYNRGGLLRQVSGEKSHKYRYIDSIAYDAYEQKVYQKYGNGTETRYSYSDQRRRLAVLSVTSPAYQGAIIDNAYQYDVMDNITSLVNNGVAQTAYGNKTIGGKVTHSYRYDDWSRLVGADGTFKAGDKTAKYTLAMAYDEVYNITRKKLDLEQHNLQFKGALKTGYDYAYRYDSLNVFKLAEVASKEYRSDSARVDTTNVRYTYAFDGNGNQTLGGNRELLWDEENRLLAVSEGGFVSNYFYDCNGERTVKLASGREQVYVNAALAHDDDSLPQKFVAYVSPYLVVSNGGHYTKHIYAGSQRIASQIGDINDFGADPRRVDYAGVDLRDIDYAKKYADNNRALENRYDSLGWECNVRLVDDYVNNKSFCCDGGDFQLAESLGAQSATDTAPALYFYHPDHLGSTAMVTDLDGHITQNVVYIPYGEVFVEERNGNWNTPYLFNAKELDEETGLYYYGARYLDPAGARWLSVDPLWINHPDKTPYNYCLNNPVKMMDPDGRNGVVTGEGTAEDPYVVTANYYYNPNDFSEDPESITGLRSAIQAYNNNGKPWKVVLPDRKGRVFVKMNLNLKESDDPRKDATSDYSNPDYNDLRNVCYGNIVRNSTDSPKKWGGSDGFSISINVNAFKNETGYTFTETIVGVWIHEIGHNLGLTHQDRYDDQHRNRTYIMISPDCHRDPKKTSVPVHPKVDSDGIRIMIQHLNQDGRINFDEPSKVGRIHQFVPSK